MRFRALHINTRGACHPPLSGWLHQPFCFNTKLYSIILNPALLYKIADTQAFSASLNPLSPPGGADTKEISGAGYQEVLPWQKSRFSTTL